MRAASTGLVAIAWAVSACVAAGSSAAPAGLPTNPLPSALASAGVATAIRPTAPPPSADGRDSPFAYDRSDADLPAGTYAATRFRYPFTADLTADLGIRDAGDSSRFVYIGQDKNAPVNGDEEFDAMLLEQVLDPLDQRSLVPLAGDAYGWLTGHPRLTPVTGSGRTLVVDGDPARQVDLLPSKPVACGNFHPNLSCVLIGYGPDGDEPFTLFDGSRMRIVVMDHDGTEILFAYQATDDARFARRAAVFDDWVASLDFR